VREASRGRFLPVSLAVLVAAAVIAGACAGCSRALPEEGSAVASLYVARCSADCHSPHQPASMTVAMWRLQVARMEPVIARAGLPPLSARDREQIIAYLERNADGRGQ